MNNQEPTSDYILVVEDDKLLLKAILDKLHTEGFKAKGFISGSEAMKMIIDNEEKPSMIWLDYYLGDTNGLALLKIIKATPQVSSVPIFIVSNSAGGEKVKHLLTMGADEYIVKANFTLKEIIEKIKEHLNKQTS